MKKLIIIIFFFSQLSVANSNSNIVYLDVQFIIDNSKLGVLYKNKISISQKKSKNLLIEDEKILKDKEVYINDKKNILRKEELDTNLKEFKKMFDIYNNKRNEYRKKIIEEKNKYTTEILNLLNPILTDYVDQNNIFLVIEKKNVLVGAKALDITEQILEVFNNETKKQVLSNEN